MTYRIYHLERRSTSFACFKHSEVRFFAYLWLQLIKAKFHYAIWFEPASNQLAQWNLAFTCTVSVPQQSC